MDDNQLPKLLSRVEIAQYLKVSERTIVRYEKKGLPVIKLSSQEKRYDLEQVRDWLLTERSK